MAEGRQRDLPAPGPDICSKMCLFAPEAITDWLLAYFQPVGALFLRLRVHVPEIYILLTYFDSYYLKFLICPGLIMLLLFLRSSGPSSPKNSCISLLFLGGNTQTTSLGELLEMPNN